jgi:TetR/AcrR family transcriptional regulator
MAQARRLGKEDSDNRVRFVDAAERILAEDGSAALSARTVAERAGLKPQLLYYYFRGMDDLLGAVVRRVNERRLERFERALAADRPLRAVWELSCDPSSAALAAELSAVASHRESIRAEIIESARQFRARQTEAVAALLPSAYRNGGEVTAAGIVMIAAALSRMVVAESALGLTEGHDDALAIVDRLIAMFEPAASA